MWANISFSSNWWRWTDLYKNYLIFTEVKPETIHWITVSFPANQNMKCSIFKIVFFSCCWCCYKNATMHCIFAIKIGREKNRNIFTLIRLNVPHNRFPFIQPSEPFNYLNEWIENSIIFMFILLFLPVFSVSLSLLF